MKNRPRTLAYHENGDGSLLVPPKRILYFAPNTIESNSRSGIQRVVVSCAEALLRVAPVDFVKWDRLDGQLRYFNRRDLESFFRAPVFPKGARINRFAERRRYRFFDTITSSERSDVWLFMPEVSYFIDRGAEVYSRVMAQARDYGFRTAAVFYDLIPITNALYRMEGKRHHERYVRELLQVDLILPISQYSANELIRYFRDDLTVSDDHRKALGQKIIPVPLATQNSISIKTDLDSVPDFDKNLVLMLGTVEPRKQQVVALRAFQQRQIAQKYGLRVVVIGSLHPAGHEGFLEIVANDPAISYMGYVDDSTIADLFQRARFSIFASNDEGFGLPICESLAHGVPCLTANFGSMAEVAEGGGCHLVDVKDLEALAQGIETLASDDNLVAVLRAEIAARKFRTWGDYAKDIVGAFLDYSEDSHRIASFANEITELINASLDVDALENSTVGLYFASVLDCGWKILVDSESSSETRALLEATMQDGNTRNLLLLRKLSVDAIVADDAFVRLALAVDVWVIAKREVYEALIRRAACISYDGLPPTRCCVVEEFNAETVGAVVGALVADFVIKKDERRRAALRDQTLRYSGNASVGLPERGPRLQIVITTYNRSPFVAENVRWILSDIEHLDGEVVLTVVDNASTDGTFDAIALYANSPCLKIIRNLANVGMLGNLNICSTIPSARHTWFIGDDDFIVPGTIERVLSELRRDPYLPYLFMNFGVYHRERWTAGDRADQLIRNPIVLAPNASPSGLYKISDVAVQHDNLFTAIYPIVFRVDHAAACFNFPFIDEPFGSLTESIPTTRYILERCGETEVFWLADVGIVGNAHNSWRKYRVRWHSVIMALSYELAKEAGVSETVLRRWTGIQRNLFEEARTLFPEEQLSSIFTADALESTHRVFLDRLG